MLRQLALGGVISFANIALHAIVMTNVVGAARRVLHWDRIRPELWLATIMIASVGLLMAAHLAEVFVWSFGYRAVGVVPSEADEIYFAFVSYTTIGYGDIVPVPEWRLMGPMTGMNGILLFGWSTAVIFEILREAMRIRDLGSRRRSSR